MYVRTHREYCERTIIRKHGDSAWIVAMQADMKEFLMVHVKGRFMLAQLDGFVDPDSSDKVYRLSGNPPIWLETVREQLDVKNARTVLQNVIRRGEYVGRYLQVVLSNVGCGHQLQDYGFNYNKYQFVFGTLNQP
ncbi:hypothetical protein Tco_1192127 [Tanacetum coccineum]